MKRVSQLLLAISFIAISCSDETTVFEDRLQDDISIEENEAKLQSSINFDNAGVLDIYEEDQITGKTARGGANQQVGDYPLTLVAQIEAPSYDGATNLGATHVFIDGDYAYVSYNTVEGGYAGGVDIINISDPNNPRVTGRLYYTNADINSIAYDNGYVYAVGGVDAEKSVTATSNSFVAKIPVSNGRFNLSSGISYGFQEGFNANDVAISGNEVLVTSGRDGFVKAYDKNSLEALNEVPFADLRSVAISDSKIAVLDASTGVKILDQNLSTTSEIAISSDFGPSAKRTLDFMNENILVSEGSKGAGVYNGTTGQFIEHIPILLDPENVAQQDVVTNAVATNNDIVLMANGGAGLCLSEGEGSSADPYGIIQLNGSINYVASKGDYIFAASGTNGLQIVKLNRPSNSLVERCATTTEFRGNSNVNTETGSVLAYNSGSRGKRLQRIDVNGELLLCGSWTVRNYVNINDNRVLELNGTMVVGRNRQRRNITVTEGATLRVEGNLTVYGDIIMNDGATIEFLGDDSVVNVFGTVSRPANSTVTGTFRDVRNKF
ncbi:LVIVD repeat-containing protein [Costertonia aggregata]|uniref:LVIVD repeat-containing protein n=1 Tax=Costertonia aggregata TaxID=343403 RepID=A0A7H9AUP3_9FLAO|nr:hypothetical protein [Costertonia aggregata]QLG46992.1 hypothetical protein HYG79_17065 [Costertonia aggregata]